MKNIRTIAGMAVFAFGVLATSSCSKDEFFGLEDSQFIDSSTKTEIAMSQEYVDFVLACSEMADYMSQPMDTSNAILKTGPDGKRIYTKDGPQLSAMALLEVLKEKYPMLEKADQIDFDEIFKIAISENKALKRVASKTSPKTKANANADSFRWALSNNRPTAGTSDEGWMIYCYPFEVPAIQNVLFLASEEDNLYLGGLYFGDGSAAAMNTYPESWWPSIVNSGYPLAESDFVISYSPESLSADPYDLARELGPEYFEGPKVHYVFAFEGTNNDERRYSNKYHVSSFIYQ